MAEINAESIARRYMWIGHGCEPRHLYGDGGEMQCHHCGLDFKRGELIWLETQARENLMFAAARKTCHVMGFPWTDPRTGVTYHSPDILEVVRRLLEPVPKQAPNGDEATQ